MLISRRIGSAVRLIVDQRGDVPGTHSAQCGLDVAGIGDGAFERRDIEVGIDPDDKAAHLAALRAADDSPSSAPAAPASQHSATKATASRESPAERKIASVGPLARSDRAHGRWKRIVEICRKTR